MKNIKYIICFAIIALLTISCAKMNTTDPTNQEIQPELEFTGPWDGETTTEPEMQDNIYLIKNAANLAWLGEQTTAIDKDIKFINSIDMNNYYFNGIAQYQGTIDGNNKVIKNIKIDNTEGGAEDDAGLIIRAIGDITIKNLGIESGSIKGGYRAAGLIASVDEVVKITIEDSYNTADIFASSQSDSTTIPVVSSGLVGYASNFSSVSIQNSYNSGNISIDLTIDTKPSANSFCGGLVSYANRNSSITIQNSYNSGGIGNTSSHMSYSSYSGGLIASVGGDSSVSIQNSYNSGNMHSRHYSGGLIANMNFDSIIRIQNSYNSGNMDTMGHSAGLITSFYNDNYNKNVTIKTSFSYGNIKGRTGGGIVGKNEKLNNNNNYWYSSLSSSEMNTIGGTELTADAFKQSINFDGFNFGTTWNRPEDTGKKYPTLKTTVSM